MSRWLQVKGVEIMKNRNVGYITIIIIVIVLIGIILFSLLQNKKNYKTDKVINENTFSNAMKQFEKASYQTKLVYYIDSKEDIHHNFIQYNFNNNIEEYFYEEQNKKEVTQYNDYNNQEKYIQGIENYKKEKLEEQSHHELLLKLLKKSKVKKQDGEAFILEVSNQTMNDYLTEFHKHDKESMTYQESAEYELMVIVKNSNITSIMISTKESNQDIVYTFDKINEIEDIKLPTKIES